MAHDIVAKRLDQLADLVDQADTIRAGFAERRAKIIKPMPKSVKDKLDELAAEELAALADLNQQISAADAEIKEAVVIAGETVKGARLMGVFVKGKTTWNSDMLEGMIIAMPTIELVKAKSTGEPSCTIRQCGKPKA